MPRTNEFFAGHSRRRLALYFGGLIAENSQSKNRIGSLVQVTSSRITQWATGERLISGEKAFELGEALREEFNWPTSGIEFLWACAYWPQILEIFRQMAAELEGEGPALAAALYAWLPNIMWRLEIRSIEMRFSEKYHIEPSDLIRDIWMIHEIEEGHSVWKMVIDANKKRADLIINALQTDPGAQEARLFARADSHKVFEAGLEDADRDIRIAELEKLCRAASSTSLISRAWERYLYPGRRDELSSRHSGRAAEIFGASAPFADVQTHVIDALINGAVRLNDEIFPTYSIPPIWRMLSGWVYGIDRHAAAQFLSILPDNFVNAPDALRRQQKRDDRDADSDELHDDEMGMLTALREFAAALKMGQDVASDGGALINVNPVANENRSRMSVFRRDKKTAAKEILIGRKLRMVIDNVPSAIFRLYVHSDGSWSINESRPLRASSTYAITLDGTDNNRLGVGDCRIAIAPECEMQHLHGLARAIEREIGELIE